MKKILKWTALTIVGLFALIIGLSTIGRDPVRDEQEKKYLEDRPKVTSKRETIPQKEPIPSSLELISSNGVKAEMSMEVSGKIKNSTTKNYSYVQVTFSVYNEAKEKVGTALANVNNLAVGEVWNFKAICLCPDGSHFKLDKISSF